MRPPEILGLLEEAAGTRLYETKKKYSLQTIAKKQQKLDELNSILNERITPTLERLRGEKQAYLQWSKNQADLERLERFVVAADYYRAVQSLQENAGAEERQPSPRRRVIKSLCRQNRKRLRNILLDSRGITKIRMQLPKRPKKKNQSSW